jgi:hypothetical protein
MADYAEALHPRGPDGKWIVKGSAGAVTAARAAVKAAVAGRKSPDEMRLLAAHLKLLTAPQLRALAAEVGVSGKGAAAGSTAAPTANKFAGAAVGKAEHVHAALVEHEVAEHLGGTQLEDNEPLDVRAPRAGGGEHAVEVKSLLKGGKQELSVHPDALLRKVDYARATPGAVYHTVAVDERATYGGGAFKENYSGNRLYYKRGSGRYSLSQMHPVKDAGELKALVAAKDAELPAAARGGLPKGEAAVKLRAAATKAHAARLAKDRARKARLKGGA